VIVRVCDERFLVPSAAKQGDAPRPAGFRACAMSIDGRNRTRNDDGPGLADLWGRKARRLASFDRDSDPSNLRELSADGPRGAQRMV